MPSQYCVTIATNSRTFPLSPQKEALDPVYTIPLPSSPTPFALTHPIPWQPWNYFWSLGMVCIFKCFHMNGIVEYVVFCDWLLSFTWILKLTYVVICISTLFFSIIEQYCTTWTCYILFICSSIGRHLSGFYFGAIMHNAKCYEYIFSFLLGCNFGSYNNSIFNILRNCQDFFQSVGFIVTPTNKCKDSSFSTSLPIFFII